MSEIHPKALGGAPSVPTTVTLGTGPPKASPEKTFGQVLKAIGDETKRGEAMMARAIHAGRDVSAGDLLALQAGVYRYVEVIDLSSKLVDRVSQSAKTVTQGNG